MPTWTDDEIEQIKKNYGSERKESLLLKLDHSWEAIKMKANRLKLKKDKLSIDRNFFRSWTKEMVYVFGYWIADGNMSKFGNTISFASNDHDLLLMIKNVFKSDHKIGNSNNGFYFQFRNNTLYEDLLKLGGIPRKSLTIKFPYVPNEYLPHFIRGYLDGDGGFYNDNKNYLRASFTGNIDFLTVLKEKITEHVDINTKSFYILHKNELNRSQKIYRLSYNGKPAIALGQYIYQNSENLRLDRKFNIFDNALQHHSRTLASFLIN